MADGNSVVVVDHDVRVLKAADHLIEMGPVAVPRSAAALRISLLLSLLSACARFIAVLLCRLVKD